MIIDGTTREDAVKRLIEMVPVMFLVLEKEKSK